MENNGIRSYKEHKPKIAEMAYIDAGATVIGQVKIAEGASVWPGAVLRGDVNYIEVGQYSNIQDNCTVHVDKNTPTVIGDYVIVGHNAVVHGATIGDKCLIGMGAVVLDRAEIGEGSIIGAGSVVTSGTKIPPYSLAVGTPAKVISNSGPQQAKELMGHAKSYYELASGYPTK
ncbi:MAG: gamma carbonic anhydrase family protein [Clostridiales bacterium]|jgi:carbonic anhydrase/acetyltransferase-like protein (isoleucine patch superfamily)|nr:gamma carbonic anhydrase family protein [Clostridiales bacterium]